MKMAGPQIPQRHLRPGELLITQEPQWVITLLGSCVAVTMFSARFHLAAICHAMLPQPRGKDTSESNPRELGRYLSHAIPAMAERFSHLGLQPVEVDVKMFGGGNVIDMGGNPHDDHWIGSDNIATAQQLLRVARFHIKAQNVGGTCGCKIMFNTGTGEVLHKHLSHRAPNIAAQKT